MSRRPAIRWPIRIPGRPPMVHGALLAAAWLVLCGSAVAEPFVVVPTLPVDALPARGGARSRAHGGLLPVPGAELLQAGRVWGVTAGRGAPGTGIGSALASLSVSLPGTVRRTAITAGQWGTAFYREQRIALAAEVPGAGPALSGGAVLELRRVALDGGPGRGAAGVGVHATSTGGPLAAQVVLHPVAVVGTRSLHPVRWRVAVATLTDGMCAAVRVGGVASGLEARVTVGAHGRLLGAVAELDLVAGAVGVRIGLGPGPVGIVGVRAHRELGTGSSVAVIGGAR